MVSEEISQAITGQPLGDPLDESALDAELEELQQEQVDQRMLNVGTLPATLPQQTAAATPATATASKTDAAGAATARQQQQPTAAVYDGGISSLGGVPGHPPSQQGKTKTQEEEEEEAELAKLQAEMAM